MTREEVTEYLQEVKMMAVSMVEPEERGEYMKYIALLMQAADMAVLMRHEEFRSREELERVWSSLAESAVKAVKAAGGNMKDEVVA